YTNWTVGYQNYRYIKGRLTYNSITQGDISYISDFKLYGDNAPATQESGTFTASPGGSVLTFPNPYHTAPYVTATPVSSGTALYATASAITATQGTIH